MDQEKFIKALAAENGYRAEICGGLCDLYPLRPGQLPWRKAPLEDVITYFRHPLDERALEAAWPGVVRGLDRFEIVGCISTCDGPALLMHDREDTPAPWCVKRRGDNGRYFENFREMVGYVLSTIDRRTDKNAVWGPLLTGRR